MWSKVKSNPSLLYLICRLTFPIVNIRICKQSCLGSVPPALNRKLNRNTQRVIWNIVITTTNDNHVWKFCLSKCELVIDVNRPFWKSLALMSLAFSKFSYNNTSLTERLELVKVLSCSFFIWKPWLCLFNKLIAIRTSKRSEYGNFGVRKSYSILRFAVRKCI